MIPGSAVRHTSVARHVTDCATRPGITKVVTGEKMVKISRISGEGFLLFSGRGIGSFGLRRNFLVVTGLISMASVDKR